MKEGQGAERNEIVSNFDYYAYAKLIIIQLFMVSVGFRILPGSYIRAAVRF